MFTTRRLPLFFSPDEGGGGGEGLTSEGAPETTVDTPEGTGTVDQQVAQGNWEDRYKEAQAWGTKSAQEAAELRQYKQLVDDFNSGDAEAQKRAAAALGIELEEEEELVTGLGAEDALSPEDRQLLDTVRQERTTHQRSQAEQQEYAGYRDAVDPDMAAMGVPEGIRDAVADYARERLPGVPCPPSAQYPTGLKPDLDGAVQAIEAFVLSAADMPSVQKQMLDKYRATKRVSHTASTGRAGTQVPKLGDHSKRLAYAMEIAAADDL